MNYKYFDVHSHVSFPQFDDDREAVIKRMKDASVATITVGVDLKSSAQAVACAEKHNSMYATLGLHPTDTYKETFNPEEYHDLVAHPKVVAIGECGLDYYRIKKDDVEDKKRQRIDFEKQIQFALKHDKSLMLHSRPSQGTMDAYEDVYDIIQSYAKEDSNLHGNVHFFVGNLNIARKFLDLNFSLSFTGVITFARDFDEVIKYAPLNMILSETDSPYAAPVPYRGKRNEPAYVKEIVTKIAEIRREDFEKVRQQLVKNAYRIFLE